jgi:nucleoid-associated protein YgaU
LSEDLADEQRSRLHAHLATCDDCRTRWRALKTTLAEEQRNLEQRSTVPSLAALIHAGHQTAGSSVISWFKALFETRSLVAVGSAAAALVLAFVVMIPILQNSSQQTTTQLQVISEELRTLQDRITTSGSIDNSFLLPTLTEASLLAYDWEALRVYTVRSGDTWRSIAKDELGNEMLWSALWGLNIEIAASGVLQAGTTVWLPTRRE